MWKQISYFFLSYSLHTKYYISSTYLCVLLSVFLLKSFVFTRSKLSRTKSSINLMTHRTIAPSCICCCCCGCRQSTVDVAINYLLSLLAQSTAYMQHTAELIVILNIRRQCNAYLREVSVQPRAKIKKSQVRQRRTTGRRKKSKFLAHSWRRLETESWGFLLFCCLHSLSHSSNCCVWCFVSYAAPIFFLSLVLYPRIYSFFLLFCLLPSSSGCLLLCSYRSSDIMSNFFHTQNSFLCRLFLLSDIVSLS